MTFSRFPTVGLTTSGSKGPAFQARLSQHFCAPSGVFSSVRIIEPLHPSVNHLFSEKTPCAMRESFIPIPSQKWQPVFPNGRRTLFYLIIFKYLYTVGPAYPAHPFVYPNISLHWALLPPLRRGEVARRAGEVAPGTSGTPSVTFGDSSPLRRGAKVYSIAKAPPPIQEEGICLCHSYSSISTNPPSFTSGSVMASRPSFTSKFRLISSSGV